MALTFDVSPFHISPKEEWRAIESEAEPVFISNHMRGRMWDDFWGLIPLPKPAVQERVIPAFPFAAYKMMLDG